MEKTKPQITDKQIGFISWKIFRVHWEKGDITKFENDERFKPLVEKIQRNKTPEVDRTITDFENFLKDNFNVAESSLFIEKILERDIKGLIKILENKNYKFRKNEE